MLRTVLRIVALVDAALLLVPSLTTDAWADDAAQTVVVVVGGAGAGSLQSRLDDALATPGKGAEARALRKALHSKGTPTLGAAASDPARDAQLVDRVRAATRKTGVDVAILVDVEKKHATRVHVWKIAAGAEGALIDKDVDVSTSDAADAVVALVQPPPAASPQPPPPSPQRDAPAAAAPVATNDDTQPDADKLPTPAREGPGWLRIQAGLGSGSRHFSYVQRLTPALRTYDLPAVPMVSVSAAVYPLAFTNVPVIRDFGVTGGYARLFTFSSADSTGTPVGSTWQSYEVGATQRFAPTRALVVNVGVGYGENDFEFSQNLPAGSALLPSADYRFVRAGADVRYEFLQAFAAFAGGSYLDILHTGYLATIFPRESVGGVEGHVGASYALTKSWELSLSGSYMRIFFSANSVPGDATVAGGALDEQTRVVAALGYLM